MGVPRAARASLSGAFRAGSGKEGGVGRIGGRAAERESFAAVAAGGREEFKVAPGPVGILAYSVIV